MIEKQHRSNCQLVLHQSEVADDAATAIGAAAPRCNTRLRRKAEFILLEIGFLGDESDITAEGAFPEQRSLGALQHLDIVDVQHPWIDRTRHRCIVYIKARRSGRRGQGKSEQVEPVTSAPQCN